MNLSGKKQVGFALTVNGGIPAPTLEFTQGDDAEIVVKNRLPHEEVSIHWHGILLPPEEDGVAYVNTPPILPGQSHTFKFPLRQNGTYWYHSHTAVQEQKGVFGAIVIHPENSALKVDKDIVAVISDWSDEDSDRIMHNLKKDGDYYLYKKKNVRSYLGALLAGGLKNYLNNEWQRMGGMDLSDVGYDAFLINGKTNSQLLTARAGEKVRVRIINAGASSYFYVSLAGLPMQVIAADGKDIVPVQAKELFIGMAETYDVLFTVPAERNYELRSTAQDVTGFASAFIGMGEKVSAPDKPHPDLYERMDHATHANHAFHASHSFQSSHLSHAHEHNVRVERSQGTAVVRSTDLLTVDDVEAPSETSLPKEAKVSEVKLVLGGDMRRYVWHINGKAIHEDRDIPVNEGDVLRLTFVNETMMHHPMHLHGHFFRVLNQFGERSPLKHTVDVPPNSTRVIEFYANEPGQWMLHCHNLYHMHTGMARVAKYLSFTPSSAMAALEKHDPHMHDHLYFSGLARVATNQSELSLRGSQTWNEYEFRIEATYPSRLPFRIDDKWDWEGDALYRRWSGNYFSAMIGGTAFDNKGYGVVGLGYLLPLLIDARVFINQKGQCRLDLSRHFQWASALYTDAELKWRPEWKAEHETEYRATLMYSPEWSWAAGLVLTEKSVGAGAQIKF